jgi:hypothetical protein
MSPLDGPPDAGGRQHPPGPTSATPPLEDIWCSLLPEPGDPVPPEEHARELAAIARNVRNPSHDASRIAYAEKYGSSPEEHLGPGPWEAAMDALDAADRERAALIDAADAAEAATFWRDWADRVIDARADKVGAHLADIFAERAAATHDRENRQREECLGRLRRALGKGRS